MPLFQVTTYEVLFRRGTVEAESLEALYEMDPEDMDLEEYDSRPEEIIKVQEMS